MGGLVEKGTVNKATAQKFMKSFNKAFETRSTGGNLGKNNRDMRINIEYTLYGDSTTFTVELDPDFYFDDNEDFLFGSTPRYIHPYEYLNLDKLLIEKIMLTIESDKSIYRRIIKFWNNSKIILIFYISMMILIKQ